MILDDVLIIDDLNIGCRTVTNDMEFVLLDIYRDKPEYIGLPVIYYDTMGMYDGVLVDGKRLRGFYAIQTTLLAVALRAIKKQHKPLKTSD